MLRDILDAVSTGLHFAYYSMTRPTDRQAYEGIIPDFNTYGYGDMVYVRQPVRMRGPTVEQGMDVLYENREFRREQREKRRSKPIN